MTVSSHVRLQAAGNSGSPGPPDPDGPVAAGTVGLVGGGLLRCCARTSAGGGEDDVFGKKWVAVYDATGAGLRRALHKALEKRPVHALSTAIGYRPRHREHACGPCSALKISVRLWKDMLARFLRA